MPSRSRSASIRAFSRPSSCFASSRSSASSSFWRVSTRAAPRTRSSGAFSGIYAIRSGKPSAFARSCHFGPAWSTSTSRAMGSDVQVIGQVAGIGRRGILPQQGHGQQVIGFAPVEIRLALHGPQHPLRPFEIAGGDHRACLFEAAAFAPVDHGNADHNQQHDGGQRDQRTRGCRGGGTSHRRPVPPRCRSRPPGATRRLPLPCDRELPRQQRLARQPGPRPPGEPGRAPLGCPAGVPLGWRDPAARARQPPPAPPAWWGP